jgi:hypothetical protein
VFERFEFHDFSLLSRYIGMLELCSEKEREESKKGEGGKKEGEP